MNKRIVLFTAAVVLILFSKGSLYAQETNTPLPSAEIRLQLDQLYGLDQRLVSGRSYPGEPRGSISGHPYWIDTEWKSGSVSIRGTVFSGILLKYDIYRGELVLNTSNNAQRMQVCLNTDHISEFFLGDKKFIVFPGSGEESKDRFCEVCAEGRLSYLVTRSKTLVIANGSGADYQYNEAVDSYLLYEGRLIRFKNKKTLYRLFPEHKQALKKFSYQNALILSGNNVTNRAILVNYCNSLSTLP